jgi:hypothetical protein
MMAARSGETTMTKSRLLISAIAVSIAVATPAFAQWQSQEPAAFAAQYPNGDHSASFGGARDAMAFVPPKMKAPRAAMMHAPRAAMMHATRGK